MKRVLFVDDDASILDALRNLLRKQRNEWDMVFALGGSEALAELSKAPFDVVVTDMRMPGMDGAALLARGARRLPEHGAHRPLRARGERRGRARLARHASVFEQALRRGHAAGRDRAHL